MLTTEFLGVKMSMHKFRVYAYNNTERTQVSFGPWVFFLERF